MANIVLAHGILGFSGIGLGEFDFIHYFSGVKKALEADGHTVYAPQVSPVGSIEKRSDELKKSILQQFKKYQGNPQLIILAHSMGGLDARHALFKHPELATITDALVTIGTPHLGSPIATLIAEKVSFTNIVYKTLLNLLGASVGGLKDLTEDFGQQFDSATGNAKGVRYYSIAGIVDKNSSAFFRALGAVIPGIDDGVVPYSSARKDKNGWEYLEDWPVDHAGQIGWFDPLTPKGEREKHLERYKNLVTRLIQTRIT